LSGEKRALTSGSSAQWYRAMIRKPLELPPAVARAFLKDMKAFFAEENRQDEIALRTIARSQGASGAAREKAWSFRCEGDVSTDERSAALAARGDYRLMRNMPDGGGGCEDCYGCK